MIAKLKGVSDKKGVRYFLRDINWEIQEGEKWLVLGSNGSGKTTLASILTGYRSFSSGELELFDTPVTDDNVVDLRAEIGFVSSSYYDRCFRNEFGLDIILGGIHGTLGRMEPVSDKDVRKATDIMDAMGIGARGKYPYHMLSKGQQQKVLLCRGLMTEGNFYVLDEPCGGLDLLSRYHFKNTVGEMLKDPNLTMVYITHHPEEIIYPGFTHVLLLRDGMVYAKGKMEAVMTDATMSGFFGYPTHVTMEGDSIRFGIHADLTLPEKFWKKG